MASKQWKGNQMLGSNYVKDVVLGKKPKNFPPTVDGLPFLGALPQFSDAPRDFFTEKAREYGPIYHFDGLGEDWVVVTGDMAHQFLEKFEGEGRGLHRRGLFDVFSDEVGVDVFGVQGEKQKRLRSLLSLPYSRTLTAQFVPEMATIVKQCIENWKVGSTFDLFEEAYRLSMFAMNQVLTPVDIRHLYDKIHFIGNTAMEAVIRVKPKIVLSNPIYKKQKKEIFSVLDEVIQRHQRGDFSDHEKTYMIDSFIETTNEAGDKLDLRAIRGGVLYSLMGTFIYVGRIVAFLINEVLQNKALSAEIDKELHAAFWRREIDPQLFRRLPFLRATYFETLRMFPLLYGVPFVAEQDLLFEGFEIPKGQMILATVNNQHFSEENFVNPYRFDAERCLSPRKEHAKKGAFCPFGFGKRTCIATGLVEVVTLTLVAQILKQAELKLVKPSEAMEFVASPLIAPKKTLLVRMVAKKAPIENIPENKIKELKQILAESSDFASIIDFQREELHFPEMRVETYHAGDTILSGLEEEKELVILVDGQAKLFSRSEQASEFIETIEPGRLLGQNELLKKKSVQVVLEASTESLCLKVAKNDFLELSATLDLLPQELAAFLQQRYLSELLAKAMAFLDTKSLSSLSDELSLKLFEKGETILSADAKSDCFYVIASGKVSYREKGDKEDKILLPGAHFGGSGILQQHLFHPSYQAAEKVALLSLHRDDFLDILNRSAKSREDATLTVTRNILKMMPSTTTTE